MNIYVIRWATQGFANVIAAEGEDAKKKGVAICMDCRNNNMLFSHAAEVCAGNGIHVRILIPAAHAGAGFAVRYYGCQAGINVTASHNPKEYNGYKVYWSDGAQLPPQHADAIAAQLEKIDIFTGVKRMDFEEAVQAGLIEIMGEETDRAFMKRSWPWSTTASPCPRWPTPSRWSWPRSTAAAGSWCRKPYGVWASSTCTAWSGRWCWTAASPPWPPPIRESGAFIWPSNWRTRSVPTLFWAQSTMFPWASWSRPAGKFVAVTGNQTGVLLLDYLIGALRRAGKCRKSRCF